jgi:glycerol-1-phosphate dehydrogenase [NAD(P)+]
MQHHTHNGHAPSHGIKVGIGTLAVTALYERLLEQPLDQLDIDHCCTAWPDAETWANRARALLGEGELADAAAKELRAKHSDAQHRRTQLETLRSTWPELRLRLRQQLLPLSTLKEMLGAAGAPTEPEQIGISRARLRDSFRQAQLIRRRFTILDLAARTDTLESSLLHLFGPRGPWPIETAAS